MRLNSTAFADGAAIPRRFTCDGDDLSPPLNWSDVPAGTLSLGRAPSCPEVEREARKHTVAEATLVGIYQR